MKTTSRFEKIDRFLTTITAIPVLGWMIKRGIDKLTEKGAEKLGEKVEKIMAKDTGEAKKTVEDEIIYGVAVYGLADNLIPEADKFEEELRKFNNDEAEAYVLFTAKIVKMFVRKVKETIQPPKGQAGPRTEQSYESFEEGLAEARKFLATLLGKNGFVDRHGYLKSKNVFSLIPPAKKTPMENLKESLAQISIPEHKKELLESIQYARKKIQEARNKK